MAYINSNYRKQLDIKLSTLDYYDLTLSDYDLICGCNNPVLHIVCLNMTGTTFNYGDEVWVGGVNQLGGLDGDLRFIVKAVSGDTFDYVIQSGSPTQLCGGFYQGFYKLEGLEYQTLPDFYKDGWTIEIYLSSGGCVASGNTLNNQYPNNSGIFYYYGTKAENKFCSLKEHLLGYEVASGLTFLEESIPLTSHITPPEGESSFLFFNSSGLTDFYENATGVTFELPNCCDGLKYNALAFRLKDNGTIGYRYLGTSGTCVDGKFEEGFQVFERYTTEAVVKDAGYHLITITFRSNEHHTCKPNKQTFGMLSIYVDGFLKLRDYNFPNIVPYAFDDLPTKQYGVPYNISIGGGTQGLLEMQQDPPVTYNVCDYSFFIDQSQGINGIRYNGVDYYTPTTYGFNDEILILKFLKSVIPETIVAFNYTKTDYYLEFNMRFVEGEFEQVFYEVVLDVGKIHNACSPNLPQYSQAYPNKENCFSFTTDNNTCGILEENFAGSFIGKISKFCMYNKPLDIETIRCNNNIYVQN